MTRSTRGMSIAGALLIALSSVGGVSASSHREAPLIGNDPAADNTDLYAYIAPNSPSKVTIIANYSPMQDPAGGPNFWRFDPDVRYGIHIDNDRDAKPDISYYFRFRTQVQKPGSFLYADGPVESLNDANLNVRQTYSVTRVRDNGSSSTLVTAARTLPANVGPRTSPDYADLVDDAVRTVGSTKLFAGQTDDPFFVDLGSIFDLGGLRPFNSLHVLPLADAPGNDDLAANNVLSIAIQVPIRHLTRDGQLHPADDPKATLGIWAANQRRQTTVIRSDGTKVTSGPWTQVSRLGNPLINEVIIPIGQKDRWNRRGPSGDSVFERYYLAPELAAVANAIYPALDDADTTGRADLSLILLNGLPGLNSTGGVKADMLRLNTGIPPCTADRPDDDAGACRRLGAFYDDAADLAAWPNGRRPTDDVTDMAVRAVIQGYGDVLEGLFGVADRSPNKLIGDGVDTNDLSFAGVFPYLGVAHQGYSHEHHEHL